MSLPQPSAEQQLILSSVLDGHNIKVSAVAGSGKTTTMLLICKALADSKRVLALTYNARLKDEMRAKIDKLGLRNAEAHSYHAFFVRYYGAKCCTDNGIMDTINRDEKPRTSFRFGCVIVDEVQDMTPLYFKAVKKLIKDMTNQVWEIKEPTENTFDDLDDETNIAITNITGMKISNDDDDFDFTSTAGAPVSSFVLRNTATKTIPETNDQEHKNQELLKDQDKNQEPDDQAHKDQEPISVQLCLFGDPSQNIYAFKYADDRFLTLGELVWHGFPRIRDTWDTLELSQSFRVTKQIANFVNRGCLGYNKIKSVKPGKRVKYLICNGFGRKPTSVILNLLKKYEPSDFFIMAPSIRAGKSPIKKLENNLVAAGYPCFVPTSEDEILRQDVISGKIVFSSIHQTKGLERKVVMLFNFDATYFKFFDRDAEPSICPNTLYVGPTRAMDELILVHDRTKYPLPFLNMDYVYSECDMYVENYDPKPIESPDKSMFSVVDLTRHLTVETLGKLLTGVETRPAIGVSREDFELDSPINIPTIVPGTRGEESVADVNGICLPAIYEFKTQTHVSIVEYIKDQKGSLPKNDQAAVERCLMRFSAGGRPELSDFLYMSNVYNSLRTGYRFKLSQIDKYDWMNPTEAEQALRVVKKYIPNNARFEQMIFGKLSVRDVDRHITGCIDAISARDGTVYVWEFKCVKELMPEHILQVLIYMWMLTRGREEKIPLRFCLLNILTDTVIEIQKPPNLDDIIRALVMEKIKIRHRTTDDEFLASIRL